MYIPINGIFQTKAKEKITTKDDTALGHYIFLNHWHTNLWLPENLRFHFSLQETVVKR